jgi:hypothetical protein
MTSEGAGVDSESDTEWTAWKWVASHSRNSIQVCSWRLWNKDLMDEFV